MNRNQLKILEQWLRSTHRKPLLIRGARQVGKSTLVRLFAEQQHRPLVEVNLERSPAIDAAFQAASPQQILNQIEALPNMPAMSTDSMLFLDEIQATLLRLAINQSDCPELLEADKCRTVMNAVEL